MTARYSNWQLDYYQESTFQVNKTLPDIIITSISQLQLGRGSEDFGRWLGLFNINMINAKSNIDHLLSLLDDDDPKVSGGVGLVYLQ